MLKFISQSSSPTAAVAAAEVAEFVGAISDIVEEGLCNLLLTMLGGLMKLDGDGSRSPRLVPAVRRAWGLGGALGRGGKGGGTILEELLLGGRDLC